MKSISSREISKTGITALSDLGANLLHLLAEKSHTYAQKDGQKTRVKEEHVRKAYEEIMGALE